jgi:2-phosphosulfolactate phosphatase
MWAAMQRTVLIDCMGKRFLEAWRGSVVVAVDVLRSTTTAITGVAAGRKCFPVPSLDAATALATRLEGRLLVGELGGNMPYGFDLTNSPSELAERTDLDRPMILISSSGTGLLCEADKAATMYAACLRNISAQVRFLMERHADIVLLGAATRGEFREEDQLCCARIAAPLIDAGYEPLGETAHIIERWRDAPFETLLAGKSAAYLRDTGQQRDLDFVLTHVDDVDAVFLVDHGEIVRAGGHAACGHAP